MESVNAGKLSASDTNETLPSLRPVGTAQLDPLTCMISPEARLVIENK